MVRRAHATTFWYFIIGLFSATHIRLIGSIAIAEAVVCIVAPFIFIQDIPKMRRYGFMTPALLCLVAFVGCCLSSFYNHTPFELFIRGGVTTYSMFAAIVVAQRLLLRDIEGVKWYFLGNALSSIITIFVFRSGAEAAVAAERGVEVLRESGLFVMGHFGPLLTVPMFGWYLSTPLWITLSLFVFPSIHTMATSATGRSAVLVTLMSLGLILFAGKKKSRMTRLKKHFIIIMLGGFCIASLFASFYKYAAKAGMLNDAAQKKYEVQVQGEERNGLLGMLMAGRVEFFISLYAVADHPLIGFGPWPVDYHGYTREFLSKWGSQEAYETVMRLEKFRRESGIQATWIPFHSQLLQFWGWYGILGALIMFWQLWKMFIVMSKHLDAIPQWFGYFAMTLPSGLWGILFSPFGNRLGFGIGVAMMVVVINVGKGKLRLPDKMVREAIDHDM